MKNKNCAFLYFFDHFLFNPLRNKEVQKHLCNAGESPSSCFRCLLGVWVVHPPHVSWAVALPAADRRESFNSHSSREDMGTPEKAEMTSPVSLSGNSPIRLDLFLAMLSCFSPSATFNKCVTVFKTPLTTIKGETLRIRPYSDYILVELQVF